MALPVMEAAEEDIKVAVAAVMGVEPVVGMPAMMVEVMEEGAAAAVVAEVEDSVVEVRNIIISFRSFFDFLDLLSIVKYPNLT